MPKSPAPALLSLGFLHARDTMTDLAPDHLHIADPAPAGDDITRWVAALNTPHGGTA